MYGVWFILSGLATAIFWYLDELFTYVQETMKKKITQMLVIVLNTAHRVFTVFTFDTWNLYLS